MISRVQSKQGVPTRAEARKLFEANVRLKAEMERLSSTVVGDGKLKLKNGRVLTRAAFESGNF